MRFVRWMCFIMFACFFVMTTACQTSETKASDVPEMVEAKIILPAQIRKNVSQEYKVKITQGKEAVQDAHSVEFEIWKSGSKEQSEMIKAEHSGKGIYTVSKSFKEDGIYYLQTHVTAHDMHVMPKVRLTVGQAKELEPEKKEKDAESGHHH
ncbi:FixH family protein [Bacillus sp. FJAT-42376]|uniref:FixH family protein n=1 Tax=Bacillus sp. FJAT-42376 TaxID=2014076 RepID=UPI0013DDC0BE|nr:FixH family protein [Bacillus sp. FJAT-42376]